MTYLNPEDHSGQGSLLYKMLKGITKRDKKNMKRHLLIQALGLKLRLKNRTMTKQSTLASKV